MASSGNVEVVLEPAAMEQPPVEGCHDGESGLAVTAASTEESQPMMQEQQQDMAPEADNHREAVATPEQAPDAEASAPEEDPADEQQEPAPVVNSKEGVEVEPEVTGGGDQESSRERLKRHRREMGGRVWVPEMWGQEKLLKDWVDCAVFDRPLVPPGLLTARRALIAECCARRRPDRTSPASSAGSSQQLRVRNGG